MLKITVLIRLFVLAFIILTSKHGYTLNFSESELKATFLYNIQSYIRWSSKGEKTICVVSKDNKISKVIEKIISKNNNSSLNVSQRVNDFEIEKCSVIYIDSNKYNLVSAISSKVKNKEAVIISDNSDFLKNGGMFSIIRMENGNVRLHMNINNIKKSKIRINPILMRVSNIVD